MKAKLIKLDNNYFLKIGDTTFATSATPNLSASIRHSLSLKNCQAIERGYDLDELFQREIDELMFTGNLEDPSEYRSGMYKGAKILLELMGDKKFTKEQMFNVYAYIVKNGIVSGGEINDYIQSLQQNEWEVEIVMEPTRSDTVFDVNGDLKPTERPKLDADGCLVLKRVV